MRRRGKEHAVGDSVDAGQPKETEAAINAAARRKLGPRHQPRDEPHSVLAWFIPCGCAGRRVRIADIAGDPSSIIREPCDGETEVRFRTVGVRARAPRVDVELSRAKNTINHAITGP